MASVDRRERRASVQTRIDSPRIRRRGSSQAAPLGRAPWQCDDRKCSILLALERGRVESQVRAPPPKTLALFGPVREPIAPKHRANLVRWGAGEGIARKEIEHPRRIGQQTFFGVHDKAILLPV